MSLHLILWRHAKTEPERVHGEDHLRALTQHGIEDAGKIAGWLKQQALMPDHILCSSVTRTRQTLACLIAGYPALELHANIKIEPALYNCDVIGMVTEISKIQRANSRCCMVIGHMPTIGELTALLTAKQSLQMKFSTATMAVIQLPFNSWVDLKTNIYEQNASLEHFIEPKLL